MDFIDLVKVRRSVRTFAGEDVESGKIDQILEAARLAPSWANKQGWSFVVVRDRETVKRVAGASGAGNRWMAKAPLIVVACGDPGASGTRGDLKYFMVDVAIAMEHLVLAAADLGLGTCWIGAFDEAAIKEILGIPEKVRVVALTPVGYAAERAGVQESLTRLVVGSKNRKRLGEIVHFEKW